MPIVVCGRRDAAEWAVRRRRIRNRSVLTRRPEQGLFRRRGEPRRRAGPAPVIGRGLAAAGWSVALALIPGGRGAAVLGGERIVQSSPQIQRFLNGLKRLRRGIVDFRGARHLVPLQSRSGTRGKF